eukprot:1559-Heterococcus_DN1.PRE.5
MNLCPLSSSRDQIVGDSPKTELLAPPTFEMETNQPRTYLYGCECSPQVSGFDGIISSRRELHPTKPRLILVELDFGRYCSVIGRLQAVTSNYGVTDNATV